MSDAVDSWKVRATPGGDMAPFLATARSASRRLDALETRAPLESAAISKGGLRIRDGGSLTVMGGGEVRVQGQGGQEIVFDEGTMFLRRSAADMRYGRVSAGTATGGQRSAIWIIPPARDQVGADIENAIIVEGRGVGSSSLGNIFLDTLGELNANTGGEAVIDAGGNAFILAGGSATVRATTTLFLNAGASGEAQLNAGGNVFIKAAGTTAAAANCFISTGSGLATLRQVSSSRRYKVDIVDHHSDPAALLALRPVSWRDRAEVEANPETTNRYVGFIAEEVDELGLTEYVTYNDDGIPESVAYDRLTVGLLDVVRTQAAQIAWLAEKVAALTGEAMPDHTPAPTAPVRAVLVAPTPNPEPTQEA